MGSGKGLCYVFDYSCFVGCIAPFMPHGKCLVGGEFHTKPAVHILQVTLLAVLSGALLFIAALERLSHPAIGDDCGTAC
jgi:hypothetical protein